MPSASLPGRDVGWCEYWRCDRHAATGVRDLADSSEENGYVPHLEAAGYELRFREPCYEHRFLVDHPRVQIHVFTVGSPEVERMLLFRDRLRSCPENRELYERTKRELASGSWAYVQDYADAKSSVVEEIVARARTATADEG